MAGYGTEERRGTWRRKKKRERTIVHLPSQPAAPPRACRRLIRRTSQVPPKACSPSPEDALPCSSPSTPPDLLLPSSPLARSAKTHMIIMIMMILMMFMIVMTMVYVERGERLRVALAESTRQNFRLLGESGVASVGPRAGELLWTDRKGRGIFLSRWVLRGIG